MFHKMGGDEDHSPSITGRTNPPNFTGERYQKIITASITSNPGKAFGENAAVHKTAETFLDIPWDIVAFGLRLR